MLELPACCNCVFLVTSSIAGEIEADKQIASVECATRVLCVRSCLHCTDMSSPCMCSLERSGV